MHVLKPFIPYSEKIKLTSVDVVINYTLDNYIKIYGKVDTEYIRKEGYLLNTDDIEIFDLKINNLKYKGNEIQKEKLNENIAYKNSTEVVENQLSKYIYDKDKNKIYHDESSDRAYLIDNNNNKQYLSPDVTELVGIYYKKVAIPKQNGSNWETIYYYQALNR